MNQGQDIFLYFNPVTVQEIFSDNRIRQPLLRNIQIHRPAGVLPDLSKASIVLFGCGDADACNKIRRHLYGLSSPVPDQLIVDLGNLKQGKTEDDTRIGIRDMISALGKMQLTLLVIGGDTHDILSLFHGMEELESPVNLTVTDSRIDLMPLGAESAGHYLNSILENEKSRLFDFVHLADQSYLNDPETSDLLEGLYFDHFRLGLVRADIREVEPVLRNTDYFAFSLSSIRQPEAPGTFFPSPNGLTAEEACQIMRYAGLSDKLTLCSLHDFAPTTDFQEQTASLAAQLIWHFILGFMQRKKDYPFADILKYQKYIVNLPKSGHDITFYKSPQSSRWWMEIPFPDTKYPRSLFVACSYNDYQIACGGEVPDRWWKNYHKII